MPIYEYQCESCGNIVENWQKITDPPLEVCEVCGGRMKKLISQSSFHLKGSGWYVTDYAGRKNGSSSPERKTGSKEKHSPAEKKTKKSDSTPSSSTT